MEKLNYSIKRWYFKTLFLIRLRCFVKNRSLMEQLFRPNVIQQRKIREGQLNGLK